MQRLQLNADEEITRKEYLKRKKKKANSLKKRSKITYFMFFFVAFLIIYILTQFYVYRKTNNFKYTAALELEAQKVYNIYYVTEGYTYDPVYSLSSIHSDGFDEKVVYSNSGLSDIFVTKDFIYGLKQKGVYRLNRETNEFESIIEKDVLKYVLKDDMIYYITLDGKLNSLNISTKEKKEFDVDIATEILVDDNNVFVVKDEKIKKVLIAFDRSGENKRELTKDSNVSYIIQDKSKIYYVNKQDSNKVYCINKDGSNEEKLADIVSVSDKGDIKEVDGSKYMFVNDGYLYYINTEDGNTLWKVNLETKEKEVVISVAVEILQNVDSTIFYKIKNEMGVYLFNYDTNFMSQVTKRKVKEFYIDNYTEIGETQVTNKNQR
ncbi:MAG: DUF5050 domain-containing protein [Clostridia bacterium]|nr:DUF5050 domain-containing protein [Clostridia bacterium]